MTDFRKGDMAYANIDGELNLIEIATEMDDDLVYYYFISPIKKQRFPGSCHKTKIQIAWVLSKTMSVESEGGEEITKKIFYKEPASSDEKVSFTENPKDATCFPFQDEALRVLSNLQQQEGIVPLEYSKIAK